jgi:predicted transcriptional regulator of viral defense system
MEGDAEPGRETEPERPYFSRAPLDAALAGLAAAQHAVFSVNQIAELGLSARAASRRAAAGRLHRIHRGVYSLVPRKLLTREGHWMAAVLACGPGAVLSHRSAAALLGLRPAGWTRVEVTVPRRSACRRDGIKVHRSRTLTAQDSKLVKNIPCTTTARTLLDLAEVLERRPLERAFDESEILELFDLRSLEDQLARNATRAAACRVRALLDEHHIGSTATRSGLEEAFLALCRKAGIPDPQVNEWVDLGDGESPIWADFVWREQRVIVETDGRKVHGTHRARERDPRRDQRALLAGWRPIRTTWRQVMRRPQELAPTIVALVNQ